MQSASGRALVIKRVRMQGRTLEEKELLKQCNGNNYPSNMVLMRDIISEKLKTQEMKKIIPVFIAMFFLISCAKTIYYSSDWQNKKITIDGKIPEWSNPLRFYDAESGINYTISNDHQNLYLCCSISNEQMQLKILRSGIEFAIDTLGKKSFHVSMKFPYSTNSNPDLIKNNKAKPDANLQPDIGIQPNSNFRPDLNFQPDFGNQPGPGSKVKIDRSAAKLRLLAEKTDMQLTGFKSHLGKVISMSDQNKTGIMAAIDFDKMGTMCYEAVIPFSTFYKRELTPKDSNKVFNYRIKINSAASTNNGQNRGNGIRGGGMRGGMGGGMGGGMRGGMGGGMRGGMGGGMRGGMGGGEMSGNFGGEGRQRSASSSGMTKIETKLKLAYR